MTENEVVIATKGWLESWGCIVGNHRLDTSPGHDIEATTPNGQQLLIECKGGVSPKSGTPFGTTYMWKAVSGALFNTIRELEKPAEGKLFAMAFPNTRGYRDFMVPIRGFCHRNYIHVFWLGPKGIVEVWSNCQEIPLP